MGDGELHRSCAAPTHPPAQHHPPANCGSPGALKGERGALLPFPGELRQRWEPGGAALARWVPSGAVGQPCCVGDGE